MYSETHLVGACWGFKSTFPPWKISCLFWTSCSFSAPPIGQSIVYSTPRARTGFKSGNKNIILKRWYREAFEGKVLSLHLVMIHRHLYQLWWKSLLSTTIMKKLWLKHMEDVITTIISLTSAAGLSRSSEPLLTNLKAKQRRQATPSLPRGNHYEFQW